MRLLPDNLLSQYRPQELSQEMKEEGYKILQSSAMQQYILSKLIEVMIENNASMEDKKASGDFIIGSTRGAFLLANSLLNTIDEG